MTDEQAGKIGGIRSETGDIASDVPDTHTSEEVGFLEAKAKSAALRAEAAHDDVKVELRNRNSILQKKLDKCESELAHLRPELAELRQARSNSRLQDWLVLALTVVGGAIISDAGTRGEALREMEIWFGWIFIGIGLVWMIICNVLGWPKERK